MSNFYKNKINEGFALLTASIVAIASGVVFTTFFTGLYQKNWEINYKIAVYKAELNAHSGIAYLGGQKLYTREFTEAPPLDVPRQQFVRLYREGLLSQQDAENPNPETMGTVNYWGHIMQRDDGSYGPSGWSVGIATLQNIYNQTVEVKDSVYIELAEISSLSDFLYLTNSEKAGGAPHVFNNTPSLNNRREVNFGGADSFNDDWVGITEDNKPVCDVQVKTNGQFVMSGLFAGGCPVFENTVTLVEDEEGNVEFPELNSCAEQSVFQGDPPLDTLKATCLPPDGYDQMKFLAEKFKDRPHIVLDATSKLNWLGNFTRDTLIMTDLEFFPNENGRSGVKVKQWWFLMPPYLNETSLFVPIPNGSNMSVPFGGSNGISDANCTSSDQLYECDRYTESMKFFHAKNVASNSMSESFIDNIVQGTYGFHFYDIPDIYYTGASNSSNTGYGNYSTSGLPNNPNNWQSQLRDSHLLPEYQAEGHITYFYDGRPTAIYVKGGPVRVHGEYKGQYTVVTDEHTPYHRHAWGSGPNFPGGPEKIDTLWNNIWLIDDIVNDDWNSYQGTKSLRNAQPEEVNDLGCEGGSENVLGLVSGANVYVANTAANGAKNKMYGQDINIHAHIIAFNESFALHYFQNSVSTSNYAYSRPEVFGADGAFADGQGRFRFGFGNTIDNRGYINLWGGVVQKFRGYAKRNNGGGSAYLTGDIGMDKNYNFDCNLKCNFPPLYPANIESSSCGDLEPEKKYIVAKYF